MLRKFHAEWVNKYSYIEKCDIEGANFCIYYIAEGRTKCKKLPLRATIPMLQRVLKRIETELGVSKYGKGRGDFFIAETN